MFGTFILRGPILMCVCCVLTPCIILQSILPLVETMKQLSTQDTEIIICQEERDSDKQRAIWKQFTSELNKYFRFTAVPFQEQHPLFRSPDILLLKGCILKE